MGDLKTTVDLTPRHYQLELLNYVMDRNAIIYLPTGAGKTYVAILALKRFSHKMERPITEGGQRAIFMCNTVELARQQAKALKRTTNLKIGFYVGERDVDSWKRDKWEEEIKENQVLVGTAQVFLDIVVQNYIRISDLSVVIIDECHNATKRHPMHEFMGLFQHADQEKLPRVIGLTGVLLKGNKLGNIKNDLDALEATFRGQIITVGTLEAYNNVMVYSTKPTEELVLFNDNPYTFNVVERIKQKLAILYDVVDKYNIGSADMRMTKGLAGLREPSKKTYITNLLKDFVHQMDDYGLFAASLAILSPIIDFEVKKRQADTLAMRNLYRHVIGTCEQIRHMLVAKFEDLDEKDNLENGDSKTWDKLSNKGKHDIILNFSAPKLLSLLEYLLDKFQGKQPSDICCLMFVERRYSAKLLYHVIKEYLEVEPRLTNVMRPQFMVGRNSIFCSIESTLERKWSKTAIEKFRTGDCNVIICSSVLEEGIDIQACNYVITLDPLKTFSSYIQTKGRARSEGSVYSIFAPRSCQIKVIDQIGKYRQTHDIIKKYLIGRILDEGDEPSEEEIAKEFLSVIPPFRTPSGATLLASTALPLLHRYCQLLPTDVFSVVAPWFYKYNGVLGALGSPSKPRCRVAVRLPLQSNIHDTIISEPMVNAKMAKISAAFKACVRLYEEGQLSEKLLPITKKECVQKVAQMLFQHWNHHNDDVCKEKPGKNVCRLYDRLCPEELRNAMPVVGEICYAYEIKHTTYFERNEYNCHVMDMLNHETNYAILVRNRLPRLAEMPFFMNQGRFSCKISEQPIEVRISSQQDLQQLLSFHIMLFRDLLQIWRSFFAVDTRNQDSYLIAPLRAQNVDWNLVRQFPRLSPCRSYTVDERMAMIHRPEDYLGKVVNKWYSNSPKQRFVVVKVLTDKTPKSAFDNGDFLSYEDFIHKKYNNEVERVVQPNQFLIEVRQLTERRNFFVNAIGKSELKDLNNKRAIITLIPELCHNFMFPGDMWLKALFLPCVLHRTHYLLHADNLRRRFNAYLGVQATTAMQALYVPQPLKIDKSLQRVVDIDGNAMEQERVEKPMLALLPTKKAGPTNNCPLLVHEDGAWKAYLEPIDISRYTNKVYPVEVDYYYKFISGLATKMSQLSLDEEKLWRNSQLSMSKSNHNGIGDDKSVLSKNVNKPLSICDVSVEDRRCIKILEHSSANVQITTAEQFEFLAALTTAGANDVFDMERLELLGDSFLKFSVSLYLANNFPKWHEGFMTEIKGKLVSNRNLLYCMLGLDIPGRICSAVLKPNSDWLPPLVGLPRNLLKVMNANLDKKKANVSSGDLFKIELSEEEVFSGMLNEVELEKLVTSCAQKSKSHPGVEFAVDDGLFTYLSKELMRDKTVADALEALLGVCVKNYGIHCAFRMLEFFGICKSDPENSLHTLLDLKLGSTLYRANISLEEVDGFLINYHKLQENLGYQFRDRGYLLQALTHPSYPTNRLTGCYQELEFIGDAILDFLVSCYIFERHVNMTPGKLTDLRSALVNNTTLGCVCVRHRFHLFLLFENSMLAEAIGTFADFQETQNHRVTDQVRILLEEGPIAGQDFNLAQNVDVPKTLGDIVEALIAAVYLDSRDLIVTWNVIYRLLEQELIEFANHVPIDPVRQLYEYPGADPKFDNPVVDNEVVLVRCFFTCLDERKESNGFASNSSQAKKAAAKHALQFLLKHRC